jgi:pimeloyl-ACP methyl ester carboxylesterase
MELYEPLHIVLVHGLYSSPAVWSDLVAILENDAAIAPRVRISRFPYSSPKLRLSPTRRIPNIDDIADSLGVYLDATFRNSEPVILVAHSQGGLIVQRFITRRLSEGKGEELQRIQGILLYATPNSGSEFFLSLRKTLSRNPQEREIRPFVSSLADTHRQFLQSVVNANEVGPSRVPISVAAYGGAQDTIVSSASARAAFPNGGILPGDHSSIIRPDDQKDSRYLVLKNMVADALARLSPAKSSSEVASEPPVAITPVPTTTDQSFGQPSSETAKVRIARALIEVKEFRDELQRLEIIRFLPPYIGSEVLSNQPARLAIMSLVTACDRFGKAGRLALYETLEIACPPQDPYVQKALSVVRETWNLRPDVD